MTFQSLQHLIHAVETKPQWRSRRSFQALLNCWPEVVGAAVAAQTRPVAIQRHVLIVATSNSAWAQNLSFERLRLLDKLNHHLADYLQSDTLQDIRFSTTQWSSPSSITIEQMEDLSTWRLHPSRLPEPVNKPPTRPRCQTSDEAFQRWSSLIQQRSRHLPLCPTCQCPTPPGELQRWSVCALCAAKGWA